MRRKAWGSLAVGLGLLGVLFSLLAIVLVWWTWPRLAGRGQASLDLAVQVLTLANTSLGHSAATLQAAGDALRVSRQASLDIATLLESTRPLIGTLSILLQEEAADGIRSVQGTLPSMQTTAGVIDDTLRSLNPLNELFGIRPYRPEVPLNEAVGELSEGLTGLPESLELAGKALTLTSRPLAQSSESFRDLAGSLQDMEAELRTLAPLTREYAELSGSLADQTLALQSDLNRWLPAVPWVLTFAFLWLGLSQLALIQMGLHLIHDEPYVPPPEGGPAPGGGPGESEVEEPPL